MSKTTLSKHHSMRVVSKGANLNRERTGRVILTQDFHHKDEDNGYLASEHIVWRELKHPSTKKEENSQIVRQREGAS